MTADAADADATANDSDLSEFVSDAIERLEASADVRRVYGDPITVGEKTLVPVARIAYGFGGGFGRSTGAGTETEDGEGGGGGGGVIALPVGVLAVSDDETRFVRFADRKRVAFALGVGVALGLLLGRRSTRR